MPALLAFALATALPVPPPRPAVVAASATARVEIIRLEPVAAPPPGEPVLLRQMDRERRQVEFF